MTLTSKDRKMLRARGQRMGDDVRLGKGGLSESFRQTLDELLSRRELIKLRFSDLEGETRQALADEICEAVGAECAGIVGKTMLLYRANPELDDEQRVLG